MPPSAKRRAGFSLTELVVALAVAMILLAVGLPAFLRAYHAYELSNAATEVADILRLARYEAIRLNTPVQCMIKTSGAAGYTNVWVDSNGNNALDPPEKMFLLGPSGNLVDGGSVPGTSALIAAAVNSIVPTAPSPTASGSVVRRAGSSAAAVQRERVLSGQRARAGGGLPGGLPHARGLDPDLDGGRCGELATTAVRGTGRSERTRTKSQADATGQRGFTLVEMLIATRS